jgi:type IV pilus assembly protein PilY1
MKLTGRTMRWGVVALLAPFASAFGADAITFSKVPLFIVPPIPANVMVILDNSQSMDATMAGMMVSGDVADTRSYTARGALRSVISNTRTRINWGLTTFETSTPALRDTHAYYMGNASTMDFYTACPDPLPTGVAGCIQIPGAAAGSMRFVTYAQTSDSPAINDVLYSRPEFGAPDVMYGTSVSGTTYNIYSSRNANQLWANANFSNQTFGGPLAFTPTDAGFVPSASATPAVTRQIWIRRGWGFRGDITGGGDIREPVQADSNSHYNRLTALLANEGKDTIGEVKNAALFTPLAGTLRTVKNYFGDSDTTPISRSQTCQKNFVVLATDGIPTGRVDGTEYTIAQRTNTKDANGNWNFGQAQLDVFAQIQALRNVSVFGGPREVETFVIGLGGSFGPGNPLADSSLAALQRMAALGRAGGSAFIADDAVTLADALNSITDIAKNEGRSGSGVSLNSGSLNNGTALYQAKFDGKKWSGTLLKFIANPDLTFPTLPSKDAGAILKARSAQRNIVTYKPSVATVGQRGIVFDNWPSNPSVPTADELDAAQTSEINKAPNGTTDNNGAARLAYLRGTENTLFRARPDGPLGDIVNSAPVFVAGPSFGYANDFESEPYSTFATSKATRTKMVYVGANDGMLHAFDATTLDELFAYVPNAVYPTLSQLSNPTYTHRFYVDGTPTVGDVFYGGSWHTLLVAGMRAGAKGLFALDVTDPSSFATQSAANAKKIVRWEFQDAADMGFVFGQPLLVKTNYLGKWAVIVGGGYGNSSGNAVLFVIDAETGEVIRKIDTGSGTNNGLSGPAAIDTNGDGVVDVVYAGDLNGNLWKFDLSSSNRADWAVGNSGNRLFTAGTTKPITSAPDVTRHPKGGYLVAFGTGRYFDDNDNTNFNGQSLYAIWDKLPNDGTVVAIADLQKQVVADTAVKSGVSFRLTSHVVDLPVDTFLTGIDTPPSTVAMTRASYFATKRGWYLDFPNTGDDRGERVVSDVAFRNGRLIAVSIIPAIDCPRLESGGSGWLMEFDAITGNRLDVVTFDISGEGVLKTGLDVEGDYLRFSISGASGNNVSGLKSDGMPSSTTTVTTGKDTERRLYTTTKGELEDVTAGRGAGRDGRAMWREIR